MAVSGIDLDLGFAVVTGASLGVIAGEAPGIVTIDNVPGRAEIDLFRRSDRAWLRRQFSMDNGTYRFSGLALGVLHDLVARDVTGTWDDVIAGRVSPFVPVRIAGDAPNAEPGIAYSYAYAISGGEPPYTIRLIGSLPTGMTLETTETTVSISGAAVIGASDATFAIEVEDVRGAIASLTDTIRVLVDEYADSVVSLLHFDGENGSATFTDERAKTWTAAGDAAVSTNSPLIGTGSLLLDGAGDYVTGASHADYAFGTGDFTIECFEREAVAQTHYLFSFGPAWIVYFSENGNCIFNIAGSNKIGTAVTVTGRGTRKHVALCRGSGTVRLFYDGILIGTWPDTTNIAAAPVEIGRYSADSSFRFNGQVDEFRITKGVARYTSNFTPPTMPFQ